MRPQHLWPLYWTSSHSEWPCGYVSSHHSQALLQEGTPVMFWCKSLLRLKSPTAARAAHLMPSVTVSRNFYMSDNNKNNPKNNVSKVKCGWFFDKALSIAHSISNKSIIPSAPVVPSTTFWWGTLAGTTKIFFLQYIYIYILRHLHSNNPARGRFLSVPDRSLRFSLMGISTQHALHVGRPPFVAVKSLFSAC